MFLAKIVQKNLKHFFLNCIVTIGKFEAGYLLYIFNYIHGCMHFLKKVIGRSQSWNGGDYMGAPGGGQKVRLLKAALEEMKNQDKIILFIDR